MYELILAQALQAKQKYNSIPIEQRRRTWTIIFIVIVLIIFKNRLAAFIQRMMHRDVQKIDVDQTNLSYEKGEYYSMCSTLESAMNGTGTKEDSIYDVMTRLRSQDDWNFLQKCFGTRKKDGGTFFADLTGDLKSWLADDLTGSELQEVRDILRGSGISY
ncbi:MAG: hypothetical protein C0596_16090 [Marinilabiliales bacterium]|nr:MAG: hypothetical protein C0596_16090 [Marinilabiliales bacterium]